MSPVIGLELQMHAYRLMRTGIYQKAPALIQALKEDFPDLTEDFIKEQLKELAQRLTKNGF